jgi:3-oxoacyl-[acyl-carrier protein] reductase
VRLHPSALDDTIGLAIQPLAKRNAILIAIPERFVERDIGDPGSSAYAMTKAAVTQLVRGAAHDFAFRHVTINNVQPGPVATDMTAEVMDYIRTRLLLGRIGEDDEIGGLVAWLAGRVGQEAQH